MVQISKFLNILEEEVKNYKVPVIDLMAVQTKDPFKILVGTILSARTKDEVTAVAAEKLFKKAPNVDKLSKLSQETIKEQIYPVGFFNNKARYLSQLPDVLKKFSNKVPDNMESLLELPGVGRKTANLVLSAAFKIPSICVDTHVHRIMNIWNYVETKNPLETEMALRIKLPKKYWLKVNTILVAFGQKTCRPVSPHCGSCVIEEMCPQKGVLRKRA